MSDTARWLVALLEGYSPSGAEAAGTSAFQQVARELGFSTQVDAVGNAIAAKGKGRPQTVYLGHIDTVPGRLPVRRDRDRITGRGACDAKGPLLSALLSGREPPPDGELVVIAAVGEETDSRGARAIIPRFRPDFVIAGEPSGWAGLALGYKGDLRLRLHFHGSRQHLSAPHPSTTERALAWLAAARASPAAGESRFLSRTSKVVSVQTREAGDTDEVEAVLDLRLPPGISTGAARAQLPSLAPGDTMETLAEVEPFVAQRTDPVVRALTEGIRAQGAEPTYFKKAGTSDLNLVAPAWGTGGAAYGPGDSHLDHTDAESVALDDVERAASVLRYAVGRLTLRPRARGGG